MEKTGTKTEARAYDTLAVTCVRVGIFKDGIDAGRIRALAEVTLNEQLTLRQLRVVEGEGGLYVSYPNDPFYKGEDYRSIFFPVTRELREHIEETVLEKYRAELAKGGK